MFGGPPAALTEGVALAAGVAPAAAVAATVAAVVAAAVAAVVAPAAGALALNWWHITHMSFVRPV